MGLALLLGMNDPSQHALVYQWWPHKLDDRASHDLVSPIISSIATFRKLNPDIAIYVLDYVGGDMADFPERLSFKVINKPCYFERITPHREVKMLAHGMAYVGKGPDETNPVGADIFHLRFCSRPFDVWDLAQEIPQRYITYADSDIFWYKPLLPFGSDPARLCVRWDNTGLFYFDKKSPEVSAIFEMWRAYLIMARHDYNFRKKLLLAFKTPIYISEEKVLLYMYSTLPAAMSLMTNRIEHHEMLMSWDYQNHMEIQGDKLKSIHATGSTFGSNKGRVPIFFKESFEALREVFTPEEMIDIYGKSIFSRAIYSINDMGRPMGDPFYADLKSRVYADD
jgi:hypothetical protein